MSRSPRYSVEEVVEAVRTAGGLVSVAARQLGCADQTIYNYRDRHSEVREAIELERERLVDAAESVIRHAVEVEHNLSAAFFVLKTLGRGRGFVERSEQEVTAHVSHQDQPDSVSHLSDNELRFVIAMTRNPSGTFALPDLPDDDLSAYRRRKDDGSS
jgi:transposase-like protein